MTPRRRSNKIRVDAVTSDQGSVPPPCNTPYKSPVHGGPTRSRRSSFNSTPIRRSARIQQHKSAKLRNSDRQNVLCTELFPKWSGIEDDMTFDKEKVMESNFDRVPNHATGFGTFQEKNGTIVGLKVSVLPQHVINSTVTLEVSKVSENCVRMENMTPSTSSEEFQFAGLPQNVQQLYREKRKIKDLYDWQKRCLSDPRLLKGENVIISLPTGAGKTLVAEVLMLREAMVRKRSCILVLPYVAIAQEKVQSLCVFEESLPLLVEEYAASKGRLPPIKRRNKSSLYIATIEKANMLINSLIETDRIDEIGVVVVDELHMLGEGSRGVVIEQVLTKFMLKGSGQIVGMSATLANLDEVARFVKASVFSTDFRPIELVERVKINNTLFRVDSGGRLIPEVDLKDNKLASKDPDGLVPLLQNIIPKRSAIIFCPTKQNCENVCKLLTKLVPKSMRDLYAEERKSSVSALSEETEGKLCSILQTGIMAGVAFHHSGLTADERRIIETAFQDGIISILCSTSTLAAGVNLPARRVIIKSPMVGRELLSKSQYIQMIGRAGRAGLDDKGDAITIVHQGIEETKFRQMLAGPLMECKSSFTDRALLSTFVLDLISLKMADCTESLCAIIGSTLYGMQDENSRNAVEECVTDLREKDMIHFDKEGKYVVTTLGGAAFTANIPPLAALHINSSLVDNLSMGIVLSSHFHLIFTIVPFDVGVDVDWSVFYDEYRSLSASEQQLLGTMGIQERHLVKYFVERPKLKAGEAALRLYIAFMMRRVWDDESLWTIAERFRVPRGWLQSVLQSTCGQASSIARFSEKVPQLWPLKHLLPDLVQRLRDCCQQELIPLMAIDGVKRTRARQLYDLGYKTVGAVASADTKKMIEKIENLNIRQARMIVNHAQTLIRDQIAEKAEEMEQLGVCAPDFMSQLLARYQPAAQL